MALSIADAYNPKRGGKRSSPSSKTLPHRRATTETCSPSFTTRPSLKLSSSRVPRRMSMPHLKKNVQFSQLSEVCVIDQSSRSSRWYTGEDQLRFKRERISDVVSFREQSRRQQCMKQPPSPLPPPPSSEGSSCPVGLEQLLSSKSVIDANSNRKIVIRSVLLEQNRQRVYGFQDPDSIAVVSVQLSAEALDGAVKRGKFQELAKHV